MRDDVHCDVFSQRACRPRLPKSRALARNLNLGLLNYLLYIIAIETQYDIQEIVILHSFW